MILLAWRGQTHIKEKQKKAHSQVVKFLSTEHDMNSKSKGEKIVQEKFSVAIKYKDITCGLGSAGC